MIYFLVNNTYQFNDVELHLNSLQNIVDVGLIQVPHTLKTLSYDKRFQSIHSYRPILLRTFQELIGFQLIGDLLKLKRDIKPTKDDVLIIYSEYELFNHFVVHQFKKARSRIYIMEEGIATYVSLIYPVREKAQLIRRVFRLVLKLLGLKYTFPTNSITFSKFVMPYKMYNGVFMYFNLKLNNRMNIYHIKKNEDLILGLHENRIIYLNQDYYSTYGNIELYKSYLFNMIVHLCSKFDRVFFKFHPREYDQQPRIVKEITEKLSSFRNLEIINQSVPIEQLATKFLAKFVISYTSLGLLNLFFKGMQPIFIFTLYDYLSNSPEFKYAKQYLEKINYNFVYSLEDINQKYESKLLYSKNLKSFYNIINEENLSNES